jgi:hypothetical protein
MLIDRLGRHAEIVLAIGVAVEALFLLFGWSVYTTLFPALDPQAFWYFSAIVVLGASLTGMIVGFLVSNILRGALYGFLSAFIPSFFFSFIVFGGSLAWFASILTLLVYDLAALVGGVIGPLIKTKAFVTAAITILLLTSLVFAGGFITMPTRQSGNLVVKANEAFTIRGRSYVQEGNITVKDNATLLLQDSKFMSNQENHICTIAIEDSGHLEIENSELSIVTRMYGGYASSSIYVRDNASAIVQDSEIVSHSIVASQNVHVESINSRWSYGTIVSNDNSDVLIINSSIEKGIDLSQQSSVHFRNSTAPYYTCRGNAHLSIEDSNGKAHTIITHGYVYCSGNSSISLTDSTIDGITADAFNGEVISNNSLINESISIQKGSDFHLSGNLTIRGKVEEFNGDVTRNYNTLADPNRQLNVTCQNTKKLLWKGQSDQHGFAAFEITFTTGNYTQRLILNDHALFNFTSTTPLILPSA